ncbi:MAG: hypothetical protein OQK04_09420, partial [Kangiellaceae bacterium]|nr:hypothetical protein [Kangiellaceae bacterium]
GIFIREVPGGCMCCAASLPMQIALNRLLAYAKPDRLLIEPTGLGHPLEVLDVLSAEHYQDILDIQKVVTLVDARKLKDKRYTEHETFRQQIQIADLIIANKTDCYDEKDRVNLFSYAQEIGLAKNQIEFTVQGRFSFELLNKDSGQSQSKLNSRREHYDHSYSTDTQNSPTPLSHEKELPTSGFIKAENRGEGFSSQGWRFSPELEFDRRRLFSWLNGLSVERVKAAFITNEGIFGYNLADDMLTEVELDECMESRIEIISSKSVDSWEQELMSCIDRD